MRLDQQLQYLMQSKKIPATERRQAAKGQFVLWTSSFKVVECLERPRKGLIDIAGGLDVGPQFASKQNSSWRRACLLLDNKEARNSFMMLNSYEGSSLMDILLVARDARCKKSSGTLQSPRTSPRTSPKALSNNPGRSLCSAVSP